MPKASSSTNTTGSTPFLTRRRRLRCEVSAINTSFYHGVWDLNEFYDLETDPHERRNLIDVPSYQKQIEQMRTRLFDRLEATGGMQVPVRRGNWQAGERRRR
jgi:hypothetical protein